MALLLLAPTVVAVSSAKALTSAGVAGAATSGGGWGGGGCGGGSCGSSGNCSGAACSDLNSSSMLLLDLDCRGRGGILAGSMPSGAGRRLSQTS